MSTIPNNLPLQLSSFIGREREIGEVRSVLGSARLVTLTGAGGCGKTRLALAVAGELIADIDDGVWLVELAAINDPALVPQTVAAALGLGERTSGTFSQALADYLHSRNLLLILDNCEHLIDACAQLTDVLLQQCRSLKILATSRESLNVAGEVAWPVPSLSLPSLNQFDELDALFDYEAIRLFVERARAVAPHFSMTRENAGAVVDVCRQLDGIPLAIELAAVRVKVLSVQQIAARLDDRLNLLTGGVRTALPRHQTLRATMDWSYELLSEKECDLLQRLSVFSGGWTLAAAEAVCGSQSAVTSSQHLVTGSQPPANSSQNLRTSSQVADNQQAANLATDDWLPATDILDLLTHLVDKSLVMLDGQTVEPRYRMLETIRQYAREKLRDADDIELLRVRHLEYFLGYAELGAPKLKGPEQLEWLKRLDRERDNFRLALEWSLGHETDATVAQCGLYLAVALWRYWFMRGDLYEGRRHLTLALARSEPFGVSKLRAQLLNAAGTLAWLQGDFAVVQAWLEESAVICQQIGAVQELADALDWLAMTLIAQDDLDRGLQLASQSVELFREVKDPWGEAHALFTVARGWLKRTEDETAHTYYDESLGLFRELGDMWGIGMLVGHLGIIADHAGDYAAARALLEQRLALEREIGSKQLINVALYRLGLVAHHSADSERAVDLLKECITLSEQIGQNYSLQASFTGLALVAAAAGQSERAARLFAAAEGFDKEIQTQHGPAELEERQRGVAQVRAQLGGKTFAAAWSEGRAMSGKQAIAYALETTVEQEQPRTPRQVEKERYGGLTVRERQVAALVAQGNSNRKIAEALVLSERTVTTHVANVLSKLGFSSRTQIAAWAVDIGLVKREA